MYHQQANLKSKKYFKENKLSGLYQEFHPLTGRLKEQGSFQNGVPTGKWRTLDEDGDEIHYQYTMQRVGAICNDGTQSGATGRGACSWHGGVRQWKYDAVRHQIGGTGKYEPIQKRIQQYKKKIRQIFNINKAGHQLEEHILKLLINLKKQNTKLQQIVNQDQCQIQILETENKQLLTQNLELKQKNKELQGKEIKNKKQIQNLKAKIELFQQQKQRQKQEKEKEKEKEKEDQQNKLKGSIQKEQEKDVQDGKKQEKKKSNQKQKEKSGKKEKQKNVIQQKKEIKNEQKQTKISKVEENQQKKITNNSKKDNFFINIQLSNNNLLIKLKKQDNLTNQNLKLKQLKYREDKQQQNLDEFYQFQTNKFQKKKELIQNIRYDRQPMKKQQKKVEEEEFYLSDNYDFNSDSQEQKKQEQQEHSKTVENLISTLSNMKFQ